MARPVLTSTTTMPRWLSCLGHGLRRTFIITTGSTVTPPAAGPPPDISGGLYLYNNIFGGRVSNGNVDNGGNDTAQIFLEGRGSSTRCATPDTPIYLFNNVDEASPSGTAPDDAYWALSSGTIYAYNNTLLGNGSDVCFEFNIQTTPAATVENSLISGCAYLIGNGPPLGDPYGGLIPDYNVYAASSSNAFRCNGTLYAFSAFSSWKSCIGGDSHSTTTANADVNSDGSLQSGSPAVAAGENLYSRMQRAAQPRAGRPMREHHRRTSPRLRGVERRCVLSPRQAIRRTGLMRGRSERQRASSLSSRRFYYGSPPVGLIADRGKQGAGEALGELCCGTRAGSAR